MQKQAQIAVIDFGGQYAHLIAKRLRHLGCYTIILPCNAPTDKFTGLKGLILSGGPASVTAADAPAWNHDLLKEDVPIMGLCYGHQLIAKTFGGEVGRAGTGEYGIAHCRLSGESPILNGLSETEEVWMSHGDSVLAPPPDFDVLGTTDDCPVAVMASRTRPVFGVQFHPEVKDTPCGGRLLDAFLTICNAERNWSMEHFLRDAKEQLKTETNGKDILFFLSGGVDSSVAYALVVQALGPERVLGLYIDHGFMRLGETEQIQNTYRQLNWRVHSVDAADEFFRATDGLTDPQEKRAAIGQQFIDTRDRLIEELKLQTEEWLLGQGTLYPDIIESGGTENADTIKTHHNRIRGIEELIQAGRVIEPLKELYKDEVRTLGKELELPEEIIRRHPFPGPGLAINVICNGSAINRSEPADYADIAAFCSRQGYTSWLLPVKSVGVQGDQRTYTHPVAVDGPRDWNKLEALSTGLTNSFRRVNRVVLIVSPGTPDTSMREAYLTPERLDLLREADHIATDALKRYGLMRNVFQHLTIMIPGGMDKREAIVLRPVYSEDVMTARFAQLPWELVDEVTEKLCSHPRIDLVYYDITHKPPGTFGWE